MRIADDPVLYLPHHEVAHRAEKGEHEQADRCHLEPDVIGARVIEVMKANHLHIFSPPDHKDELREIFAEIIAEYQDYPNDPGHDQPVAFEKFRRDGLAEARRKSREAKF